MNRSDLLHLARLAALSAFILLLEMMLVRWVGTELRVFAYLQNGVLVAAFLGLGLGCRRSRAPALLLPAVAALAGVAFVIRDPLDWGLAESVSQGLVAFQDSVIWHSTLGKGMARHVRTALVGFSLSLSLALLAALAWVFQPLGQWLGAWMDEHPRPIAAYTANVLGSLLGIAAFVAATLALTGPRLWLLAAGVGLAACAWWAADPPWARAAAVGLALALPLLAPPARTSTVWSPYQKLSVHPHRQSFDAQAGVCGEMVNVNNVGFQAMVDLDPAHMAQAPALYPPAEVRASHYILPYELVGPREDVLVVGGGTGNDAAGALRGGARRVRAVEIDPVIVEIGRRRHPNRPYSSERVAVTIDDARAFFRKDEGRYDLIWFGLLDSHTTVSAYSNVRLDHFVYTRESFADMKRLLRPQGVVVLFFAPQTEWITARLVDLLQHTFGAPPLVLQVRSSSLCLGWGGLLLIGGAPETLSPLRARAEADSEFQGRLLELEPTQPHVPRTTDDWPYLYLPAPGIPRYHLLVGAACLALAVLLRRRLFAEGERSDMVMMLLGAGFMLLEVSGVSRAALLFGTTWTVNAYVVGAILGMILLANLAASRLRLDPCGWPAACLVASLLALALVPTAALAALPLPARVVVGAGFLALPVFFSGLIFVSVWAGSAHKDRALGSNLLGSLIGGVASMLSMAVGFRALLLLTLAVYLAALVALRRARSSAASAATA